jgi:hypothetical protein
MSWGTEVGSLGGKSTSAKATKFMIRSKGGPKFLKWTARDVCHLLRYLKRIHETQLKILLWEDGCVFVFLLFPHFPLLCFSP